ncbi:MAG: hypothetical protein K2X81_19635 [Candidatus Obscuribacterales bacterium]|nr:hypothetical protein [Candidatus Obscuribacterales bacterium]
MSLFRNRSKHIYKTPSDKKWKTSKGPLFTGMIDAAMSAECSTFYGAFFGEQTRYAVLDIDSRTSRYYNNESLAGLLAQLKAVGLIANIYQSSASRGWHLYLPFDDVEQSGEVRQTLKRWLEALGYVIIGGQLEVFPSGNALRLPLQSGFAWLDQKSILLCTREELSTDEALASFLSDLESSACNWADARSRMESQISAIEQLAGTDVQAHQERLDTNGFEQLYASGKIEAIWEKGRKWWLHGLQAMGERHDAVLAVGHYLWYGDEELNVEALPGDHNAAYRALLIEAWIKEKHNGKCRHINQGNWRRVLNQIRGAAYWRKNKEEWVREAYPLTSRLLKRLVAIYRRTGRIWSIAQFENANRDRRIGARGRIRDAIVSLKEEGKLITIAEVIRRAKSHYATVKKNWDLLAVVHTSEEPGLETETNQDLLARSAGVISSGGGVTPVPSDNHDFEIAAVDSAIQELQVEVVQEFDAVSSSAGSAEIFSSEIQVGEEPALLSNCFVFLFRVYDSNFFNLWYLACTALSSRRTKSSAKLENVAGSSFSKLVPVVWLNERRMLARAPPV